MGFGFIVVVKQWGQKQQKLDSSKKNEQERKFTKD